MYEITNDDLIALVESYLHPVEDFQKGMWNSTKKIMTALQINSESGITYEGIERSKNYFGTNMKPIKPLMSIFEAIWLSFSKPSFFFCTCFSIFALWLRCYSTNWQFGLTWIENLVMLMLILLSVILGALQIQNNDRKAIQLEELKEQTKLVKVLRNGFEATIQAGDLVVGDIIFLNEETQIFIDGLVIEAKNLKLDECNITGETALKQKFPMESEGQSEFETSNHIILGGSKVVSGCGKMVVLTVGRDVIVNKLLQLLINDEEADQCHVQIGINKVQHQLVIFGTVSSILIFCIMIGRTVFVDDSSSVEEFSYISNLFLVLLCGCFSNSLLAHYQSLLEDLINKFLQNNLLVRKIKCLGQLPYMNKVIFDKTGTLTENINQLQNIWNDQIFSINEMSQGTFNDELKTLIFQCCYINNARYINPQIENQMEIDLYNFFTNFAPSQNETIITTHIPFNGASKIIATVINQNRILIRGDVQNILNASKQYYSHLKGNIELNDEQRNHIEQQLKEIIKQGQIFAIAYCEIDTTKLNLQEIIDSKTIYLDNLNLTFLAIISFQNNLRRTAQSAILGLQQAGINVVLATADHFERAIEVATECKIYNGSSKVVDGLTFRQEIRTDYQQFQNDLDKISILYRASPLDKLEFVKNLQLERNVVGYCGDCSNDVPAISQADIGFSFGIFGSDKARNSSDIILLDTDLSNIYKSIILAKNFLDKVKGFTQFQISIRVSLLFALLIGALIGKNILYPFQLLWIYFLSDLIASIALSFMKPTFKGINGKPLKKNEELVNSIMVTHIGILSFYLIIVCFAYLNNSTMLFNIFVIILVFNLNSSRLINFEVNVFKGIFSSWGFSVSLITILILQILITQYGGTIMQTFNGLALKEWLICFSFGVGSIFWRMLMIFILQHIFDEK